MFVYQNKTGNICITFEGNKPVEIPDYMLVIDKEAKTVTLSKPEGPEVIPEVEEVVRVEVPTVEILDDLTENDATRKDEIVGTPETEGPAVDDLREAFEGEPESEDDAAPMTSADSTGAPTVEELDDVVENDAPDTEEEEITEEEEVTEDVTEE